MAEIEPRFEDAIDLTEWLATPLENRAIVLGAVAYKAQSWPELMTNSDYYFLGLGQKDPEAVQFLADGSLNQGVNWPEMFTRDAVWSSLEARSANKNFNSFVAERTMFTGVVSWQSGQRASEGSWAQTAEHVGNNATALVLTGAIAGFGIALGLKAASLGVTWIAGSTSAMAAATGLAMSVNHPKAVEAITKMINAKGFSATTQAIRIGGTGLYRMLLAAGVGNEAIDIYEAFTVENVALDLDRVQLMAKLEAAGYSFEVPGQALGEGEILAYEPSDDDFVVYDPSGNLLSSEDKDALLDGGDVPPEFLPEDGLLPEVPPPTGAIGTPPQIFGVADQFADTGSGISGPAGYDDALTQAGTADNRTPQEKMEDEMNRMSGIAQIAQDAYDKNPYLGVPRTYRRVPEGEGFVDQTSRTQYGSIDRYYSPEQVAKFDDKKGTPSYRQNDVLDEVAKWDTYDILDFQEKALEAGLINPDSAINGIYYTPGVLDDHTLRALEASMIRANVNGGQQTYMEAVEFIAGQRAEYMETFGDSNQPPPWTPPRAYMALDTATINEQMKSTMAQTLGREANQWEIDLAADAMRSDHRAKYDVEMAASKSVYDAAGRAVEFDEPQTVPSYTEVDEDARFAERFRETYETELDQVARHDRMETDSRNLFAGMSQLSRMGGGV